ncbi:MAG: helix-turn-helix transcriptional regulator [Bacteroidales bacterium]|nr:helix-turn-helix transcriptional regulator [Bacteroidales bacterium]
MKTKLKVERAALGMTQDELAQKVSVSRQTIIAIEAGRWVPSAVLAIKIARVFNKAVETLFILEEGD